MAKYALKEAARIGEDRFRELYYNWSLNNFQVAQELGTPVHQLAEIAKHLGLPTRKEQHMRKLPPLGEPCNAPPQEPQTFRHPLYPDCISHRKPCPLLEHCQSQNPAILPCEVYLFLDEKIYAERK